MFRALLGWFQVGLEPVRDSFRIKRWLVYGNRLQDWFKGNVSALDFEAALGWFIVD